MRLAVELTIGKWSVELGISTSFWPKPTQFGWWDVDYEVMRMGPLAYCWLCFDVQISKRLTYAELRDSY